MSILEQIKECVIAGNAKNIKEYTDRAVADGLDVSIILNDGLIAGMNIIGGKSFF
jgi:5-methyltetrahydrofolate--homocysteine methyltransferase